MQWPNKQRGATMMTVIFIALVICFLAYLGMKLAPPYLTNMKISTTLNDVAEQAAQEKLSTAEIMRRIDARFNTDYVNVVSARNDLAITKGDGYKEMRLSYQTEIPLFLNVSALLDFDNVAEY